MKALTAKQQNVFEYIRKKGGKIGYPPSVREIAQQFGISTRAAYDHLRSIEKKGHIRRHARLSRGIELVDYVEPETLSADMREVPLIGRVAAGAPILATQNIAGGNLRRVSAFGYHRNYWRPSRVRHQALWRH